MTPSVFFGILKLVMTSFDLGGRRPSLYSGKHFLPPIDPPCQILTSLDVNCGRDAHSYSVTDKLQLQGDRYKWDDFGTKL